MKFYVGPPAGAVDCALQGGLVLAPSGPGLAEDLVQSPAYRRALENADVNLTDSGFLLLLWRRRTGQELPRLSGLGYLQSLLRETALTEKGALLFVMPNQTEAERNRQWMQQQGFPTVADDHYIAPQYSATGELHDEALLQRIREQRPRVVLIAIGGGVQERLGLYLKEQLAGDDHRPGLVCVGAALAFLNGGQVNIPPWADRNYLGWLFRIVSNPSRFIGRYWRARKLAGHVRRFGEHAPPFLPVSPSS